jgi:5-methylthioadenosine/S-adenosylhomocysteine deaminase
MAVIDILIVHGTVITMNEEQIILADGAVAIKGSEIVAVGPTEELISQYQATEVVDASNQIVMPGLINAHTHNAMSLFRGLVDDEALETWLDILWKAENEFVNPEMVRIGSQLAYAEMIRGGITMSVDMYWHPDAAAAAAREMGFRLMNGPIFIDFENAPDGLAPQDRIPWGREYLLSLIDDPLIEPSVMPHGTYTVSPSSLEGMYALADEFDVMFITHASETKAELATVTEQYGRPPPMHLDQLGMLTERTLLAHCVHISDDEIELFAKRGVSVAHCPISNLKIGAGVARVIDMRQAGIPVLLGTDGAASSNDLDLWKVIRMASLLHRGVHLQPTFNTAPEVIAMATSQAAQALGMGGRIGSLEPGKHADIILIGLEHLHLIPLYDHLSHLAFSVGREDVNSVMIHGQMVMHERQLLTIDEEELKAEVRELAENIALVRA